MRSPTDFDHRPDIDRPDIDRPDIDRPDIDRPDIDRPDIDRRSQAAKPASPRPAQSLVSLAALVVAALMVASSTSGCGTDAATGGPSILTGNADATASDVTNTTDSGAVEDGAVADGAAVDAGGGLCGDGTCDPSESQATCPLDCKPGTSVGPKACLEAKCKNELAGCMGSPGKSCATFVSCVADCADLACVQTCVQKGGEPDQVTKYVLQCGSKAACFTPKTTCGDGICAPTEDAQSCPKDCVSTGPICGNGQCEPGETPDNCGKDCTSTGPVCGNGECEEGETPFNCKVDCSTITKPVCGNGACELGENADSCPKDCAPPTQCGNGKCEPGENSSNCSVDCKPAPNHPIACAKAKCPAEFGFCLKDATCAKLISCFSSCASDNESCFGKCAEALGGKMPEAFQPLSVCGEKYCSGDSKSCGNGQCEDTENAQTCPVDCQPLNPVCGDGKCQSPQENAFNCPKDCQPTSAVCGDGKCQSPQENPANCPKDCKQTKPVCGDGKCQSPQENAFNCPKDCNQTKPVCGDGTCQSPQENAFTCSQDCGGVQGVLACTKAKCGSSYEKCAKSKNCNKALQCIEKCTTSKCLQQCSMQAQGDFQTFLAVAQCAQSAGCLSGGNTGPQCGNGKCEPGENAKSCPKDCKTSTNGSCQGSCGGQSKSGCWCDDVCESQGDCCADKVKLCGAGPKCGDGKCEGNENNKTCPQDCQQTKPVCGNGVCEAPLESSNSCPKDCGTGPSKPCKTKNDCSSSEICCNKPQGTVCVPTGQCF